MTWLQFIWEKKTVGIVCPHSIVQTRHRMSLSRVQFSLSNNVEYRFDESRYPSLIASIIVELGAKGRKRERGSAFYLNLLLDDRLDDE